MRRPNLRNAMPIAVGIAWLTGLLLAWDSLAPISPPAGAQGVGSSLRFFGNGRDDIDRVKIRLDAPARPIDVGSTDFTIEWWMRAQPGENPQTGCTSSADAWIYGNILIDRDIYYNGDFGDFGIAVLDRRIAFGVGVGASGATLCGTRVIDDGAWHHVAAQRRRSDGVLRLFIDGQPDGEIDGPNGDLSYRDNRQTSFPNDPFLVLGAEKHDAGSAYPSFRGWLDELRISTALRYSAAFSVPSAPFVTDGSTVGLYHFDEGAGDVVGDSSGAVGGPSVGQRRVGGTPAGPEWSPETPFGSESPSPTAVLATSTATMFPATPTATRPPPVTATSTPIRTATCRPEPLATVTSVSAKYLLFLPASLLTRC